MEKTKYQITMQWLGGLFALAIGVAAQHIQQTAMFAPRSSQFSSIVVFGDSLVDNGNGTWKLTNHTWPGDRAYYDGRFSNGETWVEILADRLGVQSVSDIAYGGATVNNTRVQGYTGYNSTIAVPDVLSQVEAHITDCGVDGDALYIVSGGSNDAFFGMEHARNVSEFAEHVVNSLVSASHQLVDSGARHIAFPTLTPAGESPYGVHYLDEMSRATLANYTHSFNDALLRASHNTTLIDLYAIASKVYEQPEYYGIKVVGDSPCLVGTLKPEKEQRHECEHPDTYAYWDLYHPTARMHELLANGAINAFK